MLNAFLAGAFTLCSWAISLFFFRFLKATGERIFGFFAAAFVLLGLERLCIEFMPNELQSYVYLIRLFAFLLILFGILDKNRNAKKS
ncbi:MAG TPA: DUF5985 family protein [Verrucomicrobiae bacterium]|jgi:hypothetical protein|nr:DUF5985 family protein [Verrucomicrobiae bacterium]